MYVLPSSPLTSEVVSKSLKVIRAFVVIVAIGPGPRGRVNVTQGRTDETIQSKMIQHHRPPTLTRTVFLASSTWNFSVPITRPSATAVTVWNSPWTSATGFEGSGEPSRYSES